MRGPWSRDARAAGIGANPTSRAVIVGRRQLRVLVLGVLWSELRAVLLGNLRAEPRVLLGVESSEAAAGSALRRSSRSSLATPWGGAHSCRWRRIFSMTASSRGELKAARIFIGFPQHLHKLGSSSHTLAISRPQLR
jgi:hypothetical protein